MDHQLDDGHDSAGNDQSAEWVSVKKRSREPKAQLPGRRGNASNHRFLAKVVQVEIGVNEAIEKGLAARVQHRA